MVESKLTRRSLTAASKLMSGSKALTMMGRPYFISPICRKGVSSPASMKFPSG
jgi:hypothetical protein